MSWCVRSSPYFKTMFDNLKFQPLPFRSILFGIHLHYSSLMIITNAEKE